MSTQEQAPGEPARKSSFDQADRERIRAALFRYMEEHRVGVPTLIAHMAKAVDRDQRYIPQKTLQRFLAGEMRTNDASVSIFHEFARTLPAAKDELGELSLALRDFFKTAPTPGGPVQSALLPLGLFQTHPGPADPATILKAQSRDAHRAPAARSSAPGRVVVPAGAGARGAASRRTTSGSERRAF